MGRAKSEKRGERAPFVKAAREGFFGGARRPRRNSERGKPPAVPSASDAIEGAPHPRVAPPWQTGEWVHQSFHTHVVGNGLTNPPVPNRLRRRALPGADTHML